MIKIHLYYHLEDLLSSAVVSGVPVRVEVHRHWSAQVVPDQLIMSMMMIMMMIETFQSLGETWPDQPRGNDIK